MGVYTRVARRLGHAQWFAAITKRVAPPVDRVVHRLTKGRRTFVGGIIPTLILEHRGRRSGTLHRTPVSFVRVGEGFALAATNFGQAHHPGWSANLIAHPDATVEVAGRTIPVRARRVSADEREELWPRFVQMWPAYATYRTRTDRDIRVFVLDPR